MKDAPIPQPKPHPLLGNLPDIAIHAPVQSLIRLAETHGPIFRLVIGGRGVIVVSSQALVDELCDETRFEKRLHRALVEVRAIGGDGLFTAYNDEPNWAMAHRLLTPGFGPIGIRTMFPRMLDIAEQMLLRWERFGPDAVIDVPDQMTRLTLDTIALCAFDVRFNSFYQDDAHPFVAAMGHALEEAGARGRRPGIVTQLNIPGNRRYEADLRLLHGVADRLIAERRARPETGTEDLLDTMLNGRDPQTGAGLSDENIRYQIVTFLIAGHETTSGLLSFALYLLLTHPEALARARAEVDAVLADAEPQVEHLARMPFVEHVLQETLRLWPTAPAFAVSAKAATRIGGRYAVAPDDVLMILAPVLHRDPEAWAPDPDAFRPDRFSRAEAERHAPNAWKPFGNGARACIGRGFAMQEAHLVLAMILRRFDLSLDDPDYQLAIAETLTIKPHGFRIRARRRPGASTVGRSPVSMPASAAPARAKPRAVPTGDATPLLVLYGSNTGSAEAFARRIAGESGAQGYAATCAPMNAYEKKLPTEGGVILVTASYNGHAPDNARAFTDWLKTLEPGSLAGVRYAVFGCGNRQWARTYQEVPKRTDALMADAGAEALRPRGETDAGGDFFGGFEEWYSGLWAELGRAFGKEAVEAEPEPLIVEITRDSRAQALELADLDTGLVIENRELVDLASPEGRDFGRSKRHLVIQLPEGMEYRIGDYLAVLPRNPPATVRRVLHRFGLAADAQAVLRGGARFLPMDRPVALATILSDYLELDQPVTRAQVESLAEGTRCPPEREALARLADKAVHEGEILKRRVSLIDLLERFPACDLDFGAFLSAMPPMRARQYSISSSPLADPRRCTLTVAVLDAPALSGQGRRLGIASNFLARLVPGARLPVAVRASQGAFRAPDDRARPLVLVCAGTGVAPFRGFLEERLIAQQRGETVGRVLLFFGMRHPDVDYLYRDELAAWERAGIVALRPAFSRSPEGAVRYVQDRLWQDRADLVAMYRAGASTFVCGDSNGMGPAVRAMFLKIYSDTTGASADEAAAWADTIETDKDRYATEVFA